MCERIEVILDIFDGIFRRHLFIDMCSRRLILVQAHFNLWFHWSSVEAPSIRSPFQPAPLTRVLYHGRCEEWRQLQYRKWRSLRSAIWQVKGLECGPWIGLPQRCSTMQTSGYAMPIAKHSQVILIQLWMIGIHKHFRLISIQRQFNQKSHTPYSIQDIRDRLGAYYDMDALEELVSIDGVMS